MNILRYMDDLEARINRGQEESLLASWIDYADHKNTDAPFAPGKRVPAPSKIEWPDVNMNDALEDVDCMLISQLSGLNRLLETGSEKPLCIRANYGVGNVASHFGAKPYIMPRDMNSMPNVYPVGEVGIDRILDAPLPSLYSANGEKIFAFADKVRTLKKSYPLFSEVVLIDHPDLQGPMDNCELLWGSELFYALYDEPERVHALLEKITSFYELFINEWYRVMPNTRGLVCYFFHIMRGGIMIRNDSAMNLSPEFYDEFILPYDSRLLRKYGGGIHFCGKGDHFIDRLHTIEGLHGINMSQPHLNDMEKILMETVDKGVCLSAQDFHPVSGMHELKHLYTY